MEIVCLDLEGVLVPEIWIAFAEETGIPEKCGILLISVVILDKMNRIIMAGVVKMYNEEYKRWMAADLEDADLKPELSKIEGNDEEIKDRFAVALKFGTAGLRRCACPGDLDRICRRNRHSGTETNHKRRA